MQQLFARLLIPEKKHAFSSSSSPRKTEPISSLHQTLPKTRENDQREKGEVKRTHPPYSSRLEHLEPRRADMLTASSLFSTWNKADRKYLFVPQSRLALKSLDFSVANVAIKSLSPSLLLRTPKLLVPPSVDPIRLKPTLKGSSSSLLVTVARGESTSVASSYSRPRKQIDFFIEPIRTPQTFRAGLPQTHPRTSECSQQECVWEAASKPGHTPELHHPDTLTEENLSIDSEMFGHLSRAEFEKPSTIELTPAAPTEEGAVTQSPRVGGPPLPIGLRKQKKALGARIPGTERKEQEVGTDTSSTLVTTRLLKWEQRENCVANHNKRWEPRQRGGDMGMRKAMARWARVGPRKSGSDARSELVSRVSSIKRRVLRMPKVEDFVMAFSSLKVPGSENKLEIRQERKRFKELKKSGLPFKLTHL